MSRQALLNCSTSELLALISSDKNREPKTRLRCAVKLFDKLIVNNSDILKGALLYANPSHTDRD